jgi:hypothetical protein
LAVRQRWPQACATSIRKAISPGSPQVREAAAEPVVIKLVTDDPTSSSTGFVDKEKG